MLGWISLIVSIVALESEARHREWERKQKEPR